MTLPWRALFATGLLLAWIGGTVLVALEAATRQRPTPDEILQTMALGWIWCTVWQRGPVAPPRPTPGAAFAVAVSLTALPAGIALSSGAFEATLVGDVLLACSAGLLLWAAFSLGPSFTVLPAALGLRTVGAYRFVRHPVYVAYMIGTVGVILHMPEPVVIAAGIVEAVALCLRADAEENVLLARLPEYRQYRAAVRTRFVPRLWGAPRAQSGKRHL